jgi:hypothetical protein
MERLGDREKWKEIVRQVAVVRMEEEEEEYCLQGVRTDNYRSF